MIRLLAPLSLMLAVAASAGVVLTGEHKTLDGSQPAFTYTLSIDKDRVRMESSNAPGNVFLFRGDKKLFWIVNAGEKSYSEMTQKDIEALAGTMDAAMKKMQEQLAKLPPEQREMMEKMMKENMPQMSGGSAKATYKKTGSGKVGSWACDKYETWVDGKKKSEGCYVEPQLLGFSEADFAGLKEMAKPFEKIAKDLQAMFPKDGVEGAPKGAPVKTTLYDNGQATAETSIKSVKKENLAANSFEVPAGFAKKAMAMPPAGG